jgi:hypothetical protein
MGSGHALIVGVALVKADHCSEQGKGKLLEIGVIFLPTAGGILAAEEDSGVTEHVTTGASVDGATVLNSAGLPVPSGVDGLVCDSIELGGLAR